MSETLSKVGENLQARAATTASTVQKAAGDLQTRAATTASNTVRTVDKQIKQIIPADQEHRYEEGKAAIKRYLNSPFTTALSSDISKARNILRNLKDFPAWVDGKLVLDRIKGADAVVFITTARVGFLLTGQFGTGIVIAKLPDGTWSAPSAVAAVGSSVGFQGGAELTDQVIILTRSALDSFLGSAQLVLSGDVGATVLMGRHGSADLYLGKKTGVAYSWGQSKGWYLGASAQAGLMFSRSKVNEEFYGRKVSARDLLYGQVSRPTAALGLYAALNA